MATGLSEDKMVINYSAPLNSIIITHHFLIITERNRFG